MIRSKLAFPVYLFTLPPAALVVLGINFLLHPQWQFKNKFGGTNSAIVPGIFLVVFMGAILFFILWNIVILSIDNHRICLNSLRGRQVLERTDIQSIDLWGRARFNAAPGEAILIEMKDGRKLTFNGWSCRNLPGIKQTLQAGYAGLLTAKPENHVRPATSPEPQVFSGPLLTSLNGILCCGLLIAFIVMDLHIGILDKPIIFVVLPVQLLFPFPLYMQLFYFRLTADELEIRNHIFFWYRKCYPLTEIAGIIFEKSGNWSYMLRVRTYDYRSKSYSAGTLRDHHWLVLGKALKKRGLQVKSELPRVKLYA